MASRSFLCVSSKNKVNFRPLVYLLRNNNFNRVLPSWAFSSARLILKRCMMLMILITGVSKTQTSKLQTRLEKEILMTSTATNPKCHITQQSRVDN